MAITFGRGDIIWILEHLETLREGVWPPSDSGYIDPKVKIQARAKAFFVEPIDMVSEVLRRLELTGLDGLMVLCHHAHNHSEESLSRFFRIPVGGVKIRMEMCLDRIAGWNFPQNWMIGRAMMRQSTQQYRKP